MGHRFPFAFLAYLSAVALLGPFLPLFADEPADPDAISSTPAEPRAVEVTFTDKSVLKLLLADERFEIVTPHGKLQIPTEDVLRIEFAHRPPAEVTQAIDALMGRLRDSDPDVQKAAAAELVAMREQAYLPLVKAAKSGDPAIVPQAEKALARLRKAVPKKELDAVRDEDFITTPETKIAGRIAMPSLKIRTSQFGELALKLADARSLRHQSLMASEPLEESLTALPDPGNLKAYESQIGQTFAFTVTGAAEGGGLWGTDKYTTDSKLALAAVHAGAVKLGETKVVRVKIHPSPDSFMGSSRNGVGSSGYGRYTAAYEVLPADADDE